MDTNLYAKGENLRLSEEYKMNKTIEEKISVVECLDINVV